MDIILYEQTFNYNSANGQGDYFWAEMKRIREKKSRWVVMLVNRRDYYLNLLCPI